MALLVLAYPELSKDDFVRIQAFRRVHDELYFKVVKPHFTLVSAEPNWSIKRFVEEIKNQTLEVQPFDFCLRCAKIDKDPFVDYYHAFLVPDEGYSDMVKLHDRLYGSALPSPRRLHVDFIPHLGVGNSRDPARCFDMARRWNQQDFAIPGRVRALDVVTYENRAVETVERIQLSP